jgi:hypothetical protein
MNFARMNSTAKRFEMPGRMIIACWFEGEVQSSPDDVQAITRRDRNDFFIQQTLQALQRAKHPNQFMRLCIAIFGNHAATNTASNSADIFHVSFAGIMTHIARVKGIDVMEHLVGVFSCTGVAVEIPSRLIDTCWSRERQRSSSFKH